MLESNQGMLVLRRLRRRQTSRMSDKSALIRRLIQAKNHADLKHVAISQAAGISEQAVSQWFKTGRISAKNLKVFADLAEVDYEWLAFGTGTRRPKSEGVRLSAGHVLFQEPEDLPDDFITGDIFPGVQARGGGGHVPDESERYAFAFRRESLEKEGLTTDIGFYKVRGNSMAPEYQHGDVVTAHHPDKRAPRESSGDRLAFVFMDSYEMRIKYWPLPKTADCESCRKTQ